MLQRQTIYMSRESSFIHLLSTEQRDRRQAQADRRLASIGAEPQASGGPQALGIGLHHRGRDKSFSFDARRGDYIPILDIIHPVLHCLRRFSDPSSTIPSTLTTLGTSLADSSVGSRSLEES